MNIKSTFSSAERPQ